jgi:hypothetical protein
MFDIPPHEVHDGTYTRLSASFSTPWRQGTFKSTSEDA